MNGEDLIFFDNINNTVCDDLKKVITADSRVSVLTESFSIYAYRELKKQLDRAASFRFVYAGPVFVKENKGKTKREFYIPKVHEQNLFGTEFEIRLRNGLTQKAIARECAEWVRGKARFRTNTSDEQMKQHFINVETGGVTYTYYQVNDFTTEGLGCERGNSAYNYVMRMSGPTADRFVSTFETVWKDGGLSDVTDAVAESMAYAYNENSPEFVYYLTLNSVFSEFLENVTDDELPNEATGYRGSKIWGMLYDFQRDAAYSIINRLEKYDGCILADSVGLGKTFTALAVIKYYENRNKSVLVLCPKRLSENWNTYKSNYVNNPIAADRLNYDVLFHTDLNRTEGNSNGIDLSRINWGNYDLVVIDESHNFRNGAGTHANTHESRYNSLMDRIVRAGVKTKVLMLSATPVNNRFNDLKNQLAIACEGDFDALSEKLGTSKSVEQIFRQAQAEFGAWSREPAERRTTEQLLSRLDFDFFELLDSLTIARSRKHIERYYGAGPGKFPERETPISLQPKLTDLSRKETLDYSEIYGQLMSLNLSIYTPSYYIFESREYRYADQLAGRGTGSNLTLRGREQGIRRLMSVNLLKRLESSVHSFCLTLERIHSLIKDTIGVIDRFEASGKEGELPEGLASLGGEEFDDEDTDEELFSVGRKVRIALEDMDYVSWRRDLKADEETLALLLDYTKGITPEHDCKLKELARFMDDKQCHPLNEGNRKILVFSAFADTAEYLYDELSPMLLEKYGIHSALVTGSANSRTTLKGVRPTYNNLLTLFSPLSKDKEAIMPGVKEEVDILFATDCISEGQNLQDCDCVVNYDIHWNPVRIIQRFGRIDRIGSRNAKIRLANFWPDIPLDEYINLKDRVETRMRIAVLTASGDDDLLNADEKGDLEYRKAQLLRLQKEVVDLEDMDTGISITDLGLNEFRLDLVSYVRENGDLGSYPKGMHAVVPATEECRSGTVFVLKNRNSGVNRDNLNRIHPFYMVYVGSSGEVLCDHLHPKQLLDTLRALCKGKNEPVPAVYRGFNEETKDGKDMGSVSLLLNDAISSIIEKKEESDIGSLFRAGGTTALRSQISGLDDFELICFFVVREEDEK